MNARTVAAACRRAAALREAAEYLRRRGAQGLAAVWVLCPGEEDHYFERPELIAAAGLEQAPAACG